MQTSGSGMGLWNVTLTSAQNERLGIELRTGSAGSTHAQTILGVDLPGIWTFSSGIAEGPADRAPWLGYYDLAARALYNTTVAVFSGDDRDRKDTRAPRVPLPPATIPPATRDLPIDAVASDTFASNIDSDRLR